MPDTLPATLDRLRSSALRRSLAVLTTVDPVSLWLTWPTASTALVAIVSGTQAAAAHAVTQHLEQRLDTAVGARLGWDLTGLVTESVNTGRLAARMAATPQLVSARVAAGATPVDAFAKTATWVTQIAGSVAHETARQGTALATAAVPVWSGWRWDPEAGACPWCRMQASRGAVFKADTVLHSHAHCRCDAVEVTDRAEAGRIAADGRAEWARMQATGDVPAAQRRRGLPRPGADPSRVQPGAQTPERLASVRAQIASYQRNPASGGKAAEWQAQRLAELRAEEQRLTNGGVGGSGGGPSGTSWRMPDDDGDRLVADLDRGFSLWAADLSSEQRAAAARWQGLDRFYRDINAQSRAGTLHGEALAVAEHLDDMISTGAMPTAATVWRGQRSAVSALGRDLGDDLEVLRTELVGQSRSIDGYLAATARRSVAIEEFTIPPGAGGRFMWRIDVSQGTPAAWIRAAGSPDLAYQAEVLFDAGSTLLITGVDRLDGLIVVSASLSRAGVR